jgi:hypothetical protein
VVRAGQADSDSDLPDRDYQRLGSEAAVTSRGDSDGRSAPGRGRVRRADSDSDSQAVSLRADSEHGPGPDPAAQPGLGAPALSLYRGRDNLLPGSPTLSPSHCASREFDSA